MAARKLPTVLIVAAVAFLFLQVVSGRGDRTNPPDGALVSFDSPATETLAKRACFDCHSNRTHWPWYSAIAPISWRIQRHVVEGREKLNFTDFVPANEKVADAAGEAGETVTKKKMPPVDYLLLHPEARLTAAESATLASGLDAMFASFVEAHGEGGGHGGGEAGESERNEHQP